MNFRKIEIEEFDKLKRVFPGNEELWEKYKNMQIEKIEKKEIDILQRLQELKLEK